jgi:hypothetical protein
MSRCTSKSCSTPAASSAGREAHLRTVAAPPDVDGHANLEDRRAFRSRFNWFVQANP